jgi:hypothetical protein
MIGRSLTIFRLAFALTGCSAAPIDINFTQAHQAYADNTIDCSACSTPLPL